MTTINTLKLAIYYAYPSAVNGTNSVSGAVNVFKDYNIVVFGDGLENNNHPDHTNTINIIQHSNMVNTSVYGYIDSTIALNTNKTNITNWLAMGVKGIFCDKFGYNNGMTRAGQNNLVNYIHGKNLKAMVNASNPDDVFGTTTCGNNSSGTGTVLSNNDWYLYEGYQVANGSYVLASDWITKSNKLIEYRTSYGTKIATITTTNVTTFDQNKWDYSFFSAILYNFDAAGWGELSYSSSGSLPFRMRKIYYGTKLIGNIMNNETIYSRQMNDGILVNTMNHTVSTIL